LNIQSASIYINKESTIAAMDEQMKLLKEKTLAKKRGEGYLQRGAA